MGPREGWLSLIALTDEATGRTLARLTREDSVQENLQTLRHYVATWGRPLRIQTDRSTLYGGQIQRALTELDIEWTPADSPRVRGRSAVFFNQARKLLPHQLTAARVRTLEGAARHLESVYLPAWNEGGPGAGAGRHRLLHPGQDLESIFSIVELRQVFEDSTVRFHRARYRIVGLPASAGRAGGEIQIESRADGKVLARWNQKHLPLVRVEKSDPPIRKDTPASPRKPRSWNRAWMNGFFDRSTAPIWKLSR